MMNQDYFDWAALAQQWIQKNTYIPNNNSDIPEPPPPPIISANVAQQLAKKYEEQGEADMEVVKDDDEHIQQQQPNFLPINDSFPTSTSTIVQPQVWFGSSQNQQIPYCNPWNQWQTPGNVNLPPPQLHIPPVTQIHIVRDHILPIPPLIKNDSGQQNDESTPVIDAAKRKILPAWIREGLEKMEREKLKEMEKIKTTSYNINTRTKSQWSDDDDDDNNNNANDIINTSLKKHCDSTVGTKPIKSSFDLKNIVKSSPASLDSENSEDDDIRTKKFQQQFENKSSPELQLKKSTKSYDEIVEELMLVVRRSLTEILLEVTTEEILNISQETYKKYKLKASSAQVFRKSALSSITGKLGLGAYADSASSDENISDSSDDENGKNSDQEKDSEDELRENIRSRQNAFKIIAQEIDSLVSQEEARNEKTKERRSTERSSYSSSKGYSGSGNSSGGVGNNNSTLSSSITKKYGGDMEFGETQHTDKKSLSNGKRPKERTSRFSDNKDSRHKSASSSSHYLVPTTASLPSAAPPAPPFLISTQSKGSVTESDGKSYSSTSRKHRNSSSSSNESKSSSRHSYNRRHRYDSEHSNRHKKSTKDDDRYLSSYKKHDNNNDDSSSRRRRRMHNHEGNSSDSDDYHHRHRKNSSSNSEIKSTRRGKSRSRSKSRTTSIRSRSRSRSRSSYSSSRRYDRY